MEISDRRYQELVASMGIRQRGSGGSDRAQSPDNATFERRAEVDAVLLETWAARAARVKARRIASRIFAKQIHHQHADPVTTLANVAPEAKEILLVEPDPDGLRAVLAGLRLVADVEACSEFRAARARLLAHPPDLLVTNLRLGAYNGLHLVHLAAGTHTRCIAYTTSNDLVLAREVQVAGAFYEQAKRLPVALPSYMNAMLPRHDRRDPTVLDRRLIFRGGRRCTDFK